MTHRVNNLLIAEREKLPLTDGSYLLHFNRCGFHVAVGADADQRLFMKAD